MIYSPYDILNVALDADAKSIKRTYKRLIRQYTPEHHPDKFMEIRSAYESLTGLEAKLYQKEFPIYKRPLAFFEAKESEKEIVQDKNFNFDLFKTVVETPFNTTVELNQFLDIDQPTF